MDLSATQWIVNALIWGMTAAGLFFGIRGRLRRKKAGVPPRPPYPSA